MWAYLDHALEAEPVEEFEAHLETCQRCCGELEFSRHVRDMVADRESAIPMPAELRRRMERLITHGETRRQS
jgi:mycothiol system anti-sigma-R factor